VRIFIFPLKVVQSTTMDLNVSQIRFKTALVITLMVGLVNQSYGRTWPYASAQLIEPIWNWEEVILSRNGPSTTTQKPTTTRYTTLRNVIGDNIKPVRARGSSGSVEAAPLVPRHDRGRADPLTVSPSSSNPIGFHVSAALLVSCLAFLRNV
jgi:hypothetical protein